MVGRLTACVVLGTLVSVPGTSWAQGKVALAFTAKAGQVDQYKAEVILTIDTGRGRQTFDSKENRRVTVASVTPDGDVRLDFETESADVFVNGIPQTTSQQKTPSNKHSITVGRDLSLVAYQGARANNPENLDTRVYRAITPAFSDVPVGTRDKWSREFQPTRGLGVRVARADYEVLGFEKVRRADCVKIKWFYEELEGADTITATVTAWIETATGATIKLDATIENVPVDAQGNTGKGKYKMERVGQ